MVNFRLTSLRFSISTFKALSVIFLAHNLSVKCRVRNAHHWSASCRYARGGTRTPTVYPLDPKPSASAKFRHSRKMGDLSIKFINYPGLSQGVPLYTNSKSLFANLYCFLNEMMIFYAIKNSGGIFQKRGMLKLIFLI
jgi:hypothetical protein